MKTLAALFITTLLASQLSFGEASERMKAAGENIKGTTQEAVGNMTNDQELIQKGKANKTKSKLRESKEDIKDMMAND